MALIPNYPAANAGLSYVNGCNVAWATTTTLTVASGQARDSTNINDIKVTAGVTINGATNGANGLDTGSLGNNTFYAVYVIGNSNANDTGVTDTSSGGTFQPGVGLLSTNFTTPLLPVGYDMFRRIGSVLTDGSAHFLEFQQSNKDFFFTTPIATNITAGAATSYTAVVCTNILPTSAIRAYVQAVLTADAGATRTCNLISGAASSTARGTATNGQAFMSSAASVVTTESLIVPTSGAPATAFYYVVSDGAAAVALDVVGYQDNF